MRSKAVFCLTFLAVSHLSAQRVQFSAIAGGLVGAPGVGISLKYGTNNEVWDISFGLHVSRVEEKIIKGSELGPRSEEIKRYVAFFPNAEVSAYKIVALGIFPYSPRTDGRAYGSLLAMTLSYPIGIYKNIELVPSFQLFFSFEDLFPAGGFFGAGVAVTL
jgi:hypothetical protein